MSDEVKPASQAKSRRRAVARSSGAEQLDEKAKAETLDDAERKPNVKWVGARKFAAVAAPTHGDYTGDRADNRPVAHFGLVEHIAEPGADPQEVQVAEPYEEPHASVSIGLLTIALPAAAEQKAGFYSEHARLLATNVPGYKLLIGG